MNTARTALALMLAWSVASVEPLRAQQAKATTGLKPLTEMSANERYKEEDGGLYGKGNNSPPQHHAQSALREIGRIQPLNESGKPDSNGKIVFISISMSNATQEFSAFKRIADASSAKSSKLTIVDCAQGGQAMAEWAPKQAQPWTSADRILLSNKVSPLQVQIAWIKLANKGPRGDLMEHGKKLQRDTTAVIQNAKARFPNLQVVYLSSRIYGGYATTPLNPEPYAYESAFVTRWVIQDQINGSPELNYDPGKGEVKAPILLWGPYLWADGTNARKEDGVTYNQEDFAGDGTHPSTSGRAKVAKQLLEFFKNDSLARPWFAYAAKE